MNTATHFNDREIKHKIAQIERRKHYRIHLSELDPRLHVSIQLASGVQFEVKLINYSLGGVLFYANPALELTKGMPIPVVAFKFPNKPVVEFSGRLVRVDKSRDKLFCAVVFDEMEPKPTALQEFCSQMTGDQLKWVKLLESIPNYTRDSTVDLYHDGLRVGYEKFEKIVSAFPMEEKWWFYELLDELKRREPDYPPNLLEEFIRMCEYGEGRTL